MGLFDVHAHLTHPELIGDIEGVIARAQAAGLSSIVSNGLNPADNVAVRELARRFPIVKPAYGLYPVDAVLSATRC
jgi:TatD DNase family protein